MKTEQLQMELEPSLRQSLAERIDIVLTEPQVPATHRAVLAILRDASAAPFGRVTQRRIADEDRWLGCHPRHEVDVVADTMESTLRKVRQIIRDLRLTYHIPVLSDKDGYYLPATKHQGEEYILRMEHEARARAAASMETYNVMKGLLGVSSDFFEALAATAQS